MSDILELDPSALCVAVHPSLGKDCPVCGAEPDAPCTDDGEDLPVYVAHIGRETQGLNLTVEHTGQFDADGGAILRPMDN